VSFLKPNKKIHQNRIFLLGFKKLTEYVDMSG
jgi:hypothetical protein